MNSLYVHLHSAISDYEYVVDFYLADKTTKVNSKTFALKDLDKLCGVDRNRKKGLRINGSRWARICYDLVGINSFLVI